VERAVPVRGDVEGRCPAPEEGGRDADPPSVGIPAGSGARRAARVAGAVGERKRAQV